MLTCWHESQRTSKDSPFSRVFLSVDYNFRAKLFFSTMAPPASSISTLFVVWEVTGGRTKPVPPLSFTFSLISFQSHTSHSYRTNPPAPTMQPVSLIAPPTEVNQTLIKSPANLEKDEENEEN